VGKTLYTTAMTHERMLALVEAAIAGGVKEIHVGWSRCGVCGEELGDVEDTALLRYEPEPSTVVHLHLCSECYRESKKAGKR